MDPTQILSRLGTDEPPTDEELLDAQAEFRTLKNAAVSARNVAEATSLKQAIDVIDEELARRAEVQAEEDARLAELADPEPEEVVEVDEDEVDDEAEASEPEVLDLQAVRLASQNQRARIDAHAEPDNPFPDVRVRGVGQAASEKLDHNSTTRDVAQLFSQYARGRDRGRDTLVRMTWDLPEDRRLDADSDRSARIIDQVLGQGGTAFEAIAAAGGICGPLPASYEIPLVGSRGRPVRDALTRFGADRGGVRYIAAPRPSLDPVAGSVAVWTSENDVSPSSPAEKPCPHVDCDAECTATVDAVTACLEVGNFMARFSGEQWANALGQLGILHDRTAEQNLLAQIDAQSIAATFQGLPTIQGVLGAVDRAVAGIRSRERLSTATGFRVILDGWLRNAIRDHFTAQAPAGQTGAPGLADAAIAQYFATRGVTVTYTLDDSIIGAQAAGALVDFPSTTDIRVFPEGTWWFLDGGTLDLGTEIVDKTLIQSNDRLAFMETFEGAAKRTAPCDDPGDDSLTITVDIDPACICNVAVETSP
jgi:hypothetical protein